MKNWRVIAVVGLISGLIGFAIVSLIVSGRRDAEPATQSAAATTASPEAGSAARPTTGDTGEARPVARNNTQNESFIARVLGEDSAPATARPRDWAATFLNAILKLTLAALLAGMLAFRPRRSAVAHRRNPFVAQTQILLAVVASALMMIVGDSAARAFGIFAAVSLVRFRTNIRDPKEITVLLVSLALGLATGVGRWDLAITLGLFVLLLLWVLEYREREQVFRAMELTVKTRKVNATHEALRIIFNQHNFNTEIRTLDHEDDDDPLGCIVYAVDVSPLVSTNQLSEEILASDRQNIDAIEWNQRKNTSYFYQ
jgi:uncharacterized membrane protein YhiD involved in acid resistance